MSRVFRSIIFRREDNVKGLFASFTKFDWCNETKIRLPLKFCPLITSDIQNTSTKIMVGVTKRFAKYDSQYTQIVTCISGARVAPELPLHPGSHCYQNICALFFRRKIIRKDKGRSRNIFSNFPLWPALGRHWFLEKWLSNSNWLCIKLTISITGNHKALQEDAVDCIK